MSHNLITPPEKLPVSVREVKPYLYLPTDDPTEDELLCELIAAGTRLIEQHFSICIMEQTWELRMDGFYDQRYYRSGSGHRHAGPAIFYTGHYRPAIHIRRPPFKDLIYFRYLDQDGNQQDMDPALYRILIDDKVCRIEQEDTVTWPSSDGLLSDVWIQHTAGVTSKDDVSPVIKMAIKDWVFKKWHNRACADEEMYRALEMLMGGEDALQYA